MSDGRTPSAMSFDVEKAPHSRLAKHTTFDVPSSLTMQDDVPHNLPLERELIIRRQNSISITSPPGVDSASRIVGNFRYAVSLHSISAVHAVVRITHLIAVVQHSLDPSHGFSAAPFARDSQARCDKGDRRPRLAHPPKG
jgi:hypothetical protein